MKRLMALAVGLTLSTSAFALEYFPHYVKKLGQCVATAQQLDRQDIVRGARQLFDIHYSLISDEDRYTAAYDFGLYVGGTTQIFRQALSTEGHEEAALIFINQKFDENCHAIPPK
ncbi:hypothetical protein [Vibrio agarivorans]|uniref:hypothetical protein n=1 Tax=Vibrio agarivorans TaxID=153622 RepID=UPI002230A90B|nr:hypothetical protein [Vibrio agarivorans]